MYSFGFSRMVAIVVAATLTCPLFAADFTVPDGFSGALQATIANHPGIRGQQSQVQAQSFGIDGAKAERYPTLSLQANNFDNQLNQSIVRLQQPVWSFGKINTSIEQAQASYSAEQWALLQVQRELIEETAVAYARIEGVNSQEEVVLENISQHEELFASIERREAGQLATDADVQLANSRLIQAQALRAKTQGELQVAMTELESLTQVEMATTAPVPPALALLPPMEEAEALALENSADVRFKRERLTMGRLNIEQEKAATRPTLSFRVERAFSDSFINVDDTRVGLTFEASYAGLGLSGRSRVNSAVARSDAAQYDLDSTLNEVRRRVNSLMLQRSLQQELMQSQQQAVESLNATLDSFLRQYDNGLKTWVEVLNTQRELTELRLELARIENEWLILSLRVAAMLGNLDTVAGIAPL